MREVWNMRSLLIGTGVGLILGATAVGLSAIAAPQEPAPQSDPRTVTYQQLELFAETPSTFQQYVLGVDKPMVNRAWGAKVDDFRQWMTWTGETYRL